MKVKFPTAEGPGELVSDQWASRSCYSASVSLAQTNMQKQKSYGEPRKSSRPESTLATVKAKTDHVLTIEGFSEGLLETRSLSKWNRMSRALPGESTKLIQLWEDDPSKTIFTGSRLEEPFKNGLVKLLQSYIDVFAWKPEDMPRLGEKVAIHKLHVRLECKPVKQKRRNFAPERQEAIEAEINKLLKAWFIYEI